jgi:hypothetical protein
MRLLLRQRVESDQVGAFPGHEPVQPDPAGDQHRAPRPRRQQCPYLLSRPGVVQQDQHPLVRQQRAVHAGGRHDVGRDSVGRDTEAVQEAGQCLDRAHRRVGRVPLQVDVELTIGEPVTNAVRPVHRQRCLAHAGRTRDRRDHHRGRPVAGEQGIERGEFRHTPGEARHVGRQLRRYGRLGQRGGCARQIVTPADEPGYVSAGKNRADPFGRRPPQRLVVAQDAVAQGQQFGSGVEAEVVAQVSPGVLPHFECFGLPADPVEREHELAAQPLAQRVRRHQGGQLRYHLLGRPAVKFRVDAVLDGGQPVLFQSLRLAGEPVDAAQRGAPPQREGRAEVFDGGRRVAVGSGPPPGVDQRGEPEVVHQVRVGLQGVAGRAGHQAVGGGGTAAPQHPPEGEDLVVEPGPGRRRRPLRPQHGHETVGRNHLIGPQGEQREQRALHVPARGQPLAARPHLHRAQHSKLHEPPRGRRHRGASPRPR